MKWIYVIAFAAFVVGSCTMKQADSPLMAEPAPTQGVTG